MDPPVMSVYEKLLYQKNSIIDKYNCGIPATKLAIEFGCSNSTMYKFLVSEGVEIKNSSDYGKINKNKDLIIQYYNIGLTAYKISKILGINKKSILKFGKNNNLDFSKYSSLKNPIRMKDQKDLILSKVQQGMSAVDIAKELGYSSSILCEFIKENGGKLILKRNKVDLGFFKTIDNEIKAYILGFWYADGNVGNRMVRLQITDLDILERIRTEIGSDGKISVYYPKRYNHKTLYTLSLCRKEIVNDLIKLGCPPKKSLILKFPSFDIVSEELIRHFIRGYLDGDGCICLHKKGLQVGFCGTKEFLEGISNVVKENLDIYSYIRKANKDRPTKNTYNLSINGKYKSIKFLDWIYEESKIYLDRKYRIYSEFRSLNILP